MPETLIIFKKVIENHFNSTYYVTVDVDINYLKIGDNKMKIEEFKNITIAYMRNTGEYGSKNKELMENFKDFLRTNHLLNEQTTILGIALDNPTFTPTNELRYDVGLIIDKNEEIALKKRKIDDGKYAIFEVSHTEQGVVSFWQDIPQLTADLSIDDKKPIIERYAMDKITNCLCEFCIPLK